MKKNLAKKVTLSILAGAVLMSSSVVWAAENISVGGQVYWDYTDGVGYVRNATNNPDGDIPDATSIDEQLNGAYNVSGDISGGKVTIVDNNVTVKKAIYGGISKGGNVESNIVTINAGSFHGHIFGGYLNTESVANLKVNGNSVIINGGTFYTPVTLGTIIAGGHDIQNSSGKLTEASNNEVFIRDFSMGTSEFAEGSGTINTYTGIQYIAGGVAYGSGKANYNNVMISGGSFQKVWSYARIVGGWSKTESTNNTVTIIGNTNINSDFYIIGGQVGTDGGIANNNTINIGGNAKLDSVTLYGGVKGTANSGDFTAKYGGTSKPNILNIGVDNELKSQFASNNITIEEGAWQNKKVKSIAGFDKINFNYINWVNGGNVVETETLALNNTNVDKVVIGSGTVKNNEYMNLITATASTNPISGTYTSQQDKDIKIRTGLTTSVTVKGDIVLDGNNVKLTIDDTSIDSDGIIAKVTDSSTEPPTPPSSGGTEPPTPPSSGGADSGSSIPGTGISGGTNIPAGADLLLAAIEARGSSNNPAYDALYAAYNNTTEEEQKEAATNMLQIGEASGQSATAANIARNVSGATVSRMSFSGRGGHSHKGGHGPAGFNEKDNFAVWAQYVHGKDKVDGMAMADGVTTSYESQFNGVVLGVDFKQVNKYQSGIAFNYGEGDSYTKNIAISRSDYDFWGIGYYGAVKNADNNVIFDINYAKSDSEVKQFNSGVELEAEPETTTISAGVKVEKLIDKGAMQFVPYAGLRFMSIDTDEYSANYQGKEVFNYSADRQNIWLLPVGVSFRQENIYDSGWVVTPKVDLSYIWAFGDTENEMTVRTPDVAEAARLGYTVMNDGSFLGSIGLEAEKGDWTFGVAYSYQKSSDSRSDRWYVDAKYSF